MNDYALHIERIQSLSKAGPFEPFVIRFTQPFGLELEDVAIRDDYNEGAAPGENLADLLTRLLPQIARYPYEWPLSGEKLDDEGYDLFASKRLDKLELPLVAYKEALYRLNISTQAETLVNPYKGGERVYAPHVTKLQLTLDKASVLSTLSFQFFSKNDVALLSLVVERDTTGNALPMKVDVDTLQFKQEDDTLSLLFGEPLLAKRLTFVLGQTAADSNQYVVQRQGEDFTYSPTDKDRLRLLDFSSRYHHGRTYMTDEAISTQEIKDWSDERKAAYAAWQATVERNEV